MTKPTAKLGADELKQKMIDANQLLTSGRAKQALQQLQLLEPLAPKNAALLYNLAAASVACGDWSAARKHLQTLSELSDIEPRVAFPASYLSQEQHQLKLANRLISRALEHWPTHPQALAQKVFTSYEIGDYQQARQACEQLLELDAGNLDARHFIAKVDYALGEFAAAEDTLRAILVEQPDYHHAWNLLAKNRRYKQHHADFAAIETLLTREDLSVEARCQLHFALGKMNNDIADYESAWQHYRQANELMASQYPFDAAGYLQQVGAITRFFHSGLFAAAEETAALNSASSQKPETHSSSLKAPILIVGMPRSGTSLLEQALSSHPELYGAGETPALFLAIEKVLGHRAYPQDLTTLGEQAYQDLAENYLEYFDNFSGASERRIVDKVPGNYLHLGLFKKMFPKVKVLDCSRHYLDNALSIYFQQFSANMSFTNNLESIRLVQDQYEKISGHWRALFPDNIYPVVYEELIENFDAGIVSIFEFLSLQADHHNDDYRHSDKLVNTPSAWQVRQPIYRSSAGRWKHYSKHLQPYLRT